MEEYDWIKDGPRISGTFNKAGDAHQNTEKPNTQSHEIVTKKEVEELEKQKRQPNNKFVLTPPGMKPTNTFDKHREERLEKMKKRLQQEQGKAQKAFERANEI